MSEAFKEVVFSGARRARVKEPLCWAETYPLQWREPRVDLAELAKLRWIEGLSRKELAEKYGRTEIAIGNYFQKLRRRRFQVTGLVVEERERILKMERQKRRNL